MQNESKFHQDLKQVCTYLILNPMEALEENLLTSLIAISPRTSPYDLLLTLS